MKFYANEQFPCNSDQTITKKHSLQFKSMYHVCLYLNPAGDVTRVSVMPRKVTVKIGDAENRCRGCRAKICEKGQKFLFV